MHTMFILAATGILMLIIGIQFFWTPILWSLIIVVPLILQGLYDMLQSHHSLRRNFPLLGRGRWIMEKVRPFIRQYLIESDTDGRPINRMYRSVVYQRAKGAQESVPFGTRLDTYRTGYEWIGHSLSAIDVSDISRDLRVSVGGPDCLQPYSASILNISAMSFGSLSQNAILALNSGAKMGGFYHNTGEGGLSPHHLKHKGDLVWQIGTGYFGCRNDKGNFSPEVFREKSTIDSVRMIEIKLSQGAKPGYGGILPANKNTPEIAAIRGVDAGTQINSPVAHSEFDSPLGLVQFIGQLRKLSNGKPIGFKIAIGRQSEFIGICKAMVATKIYADFITVDGGEGGTGAAPLEYTDSIGMPLQEALAFVDDCLTGYGIRQHTRIIASGKILTGFHLVKNFSLGADICNSARGMMLALGCVQSLVCNTNRCPTGVATQNPKLNKGLVVTNKAQRVTLFHKNTVHATAEIIASAGLRKASELNRTHIYRRITQNSIMRYDQIFPYLKESILLTENIPESFKLFTQEASANSFMPLHYLTDISDEHCEIDCTDNLT
jgi:glutamate synthase domain-containing protein 2